MNWTGSISRGLLLAGSLVLGCGTKTVDPASGSESDGQDATTEGSGTSATTTSMDESGSGSVSSSSTGGALLPCGWVEGAHQAELGSGQAESIVSCDLETSTATILLGYEEPSCGGSVSSPWLRIELPPGMQMAGEYDLTGLVATIRMEADLSPVTGQVDTGTLIITEVTPARVVGWAHGGLVGYDFLGAFEAEYCP